jgi:hypothetical protein
LNRQKYKNFRHGREMFVAGAGILLNNFLSANSWLFITLQTKTKK